MVYCLKCIWILEEDFGSLKIYVQTQVSNLLVNDLLDKVCGIY